MRYRTERWLLLGLSALNWTLTATAIMVLVAHYALDTEVHRFVLVSALGVMTAKLTNKLS